MRRMSFTQELKELAKAGEGMDAGGCWQEVLHLHGELGRSENALGRAAFMMRYGQRGEWRGVLCHAAAETLREARRAASVYDTERLKEAAACYARLAGCRYADAAELMLKPGERGARRTSADHRQRQFEHAAAEVRWTVERAGKKRPAKEGTGARPAAAACRSQRTRLMAAAFRGARMQLMKEDTMDTVTVRGAGIEGDFQIVERQVGGRLVLDPVPSPEEVKEAAREIVEDHRETLDYLAEH